MREQLITGFYIQSPAKGLAAIADRIDVFKQDFVDKLTAITAEEFETVRKSELITLTQPPKNLREESAPFSSDWRMQRLDFDSRSNLIAALEALDMDDVNAFYQALVSGKKFGRVVVQMRGTEFKTESFAKYESAELIDDVNDFHQSYLER